jgi:cyclopropane-fatty-acyl-phospholipid synthase
MNHELSIDLNVPGQPAASGGFYESLIFRGLERMTRGYMEIELPGGSRRVMGDPAEPIRASVRIRDPHFFKRCMLFGDVGFGESYVEGEWDTPDIERVIAWFLLNTDNSPAQPGSGAKSALINILRGWNRVKHLVRPNSMNTSRRNIAEHYDLGNKFYRLWLDPTMTYSSAVFTAPGQSLEEAQLAKYEALCRGVRLQPGDRLLEIGCGWGGFAEHAARNYGCRVTGVTISQAQYDFAQDRIQRAGLSDRVQIRLQDYRQIEGRFDKIVSIEMMEALGDKYIETFTAKIHALLVPDGIAGLQYITVPDCRHGELKRGVDWIQRHIFPGSLLLSVGRVNQALNRTGDLFLHALSDHGLSYSRTLRLWREAFNRQLETVRNLGFDDRFIRKWNYYLSYCEAAFAMRNISVVQAIYTRPNNRRLGETTDLSR